METNSLQAEQREREKEHKRGTKLWQKVKE